MTTTERLIAAGDALYQAWIDERRTMYAWSSSYTNRIEAAETAANAGRAWRALVAEVRGERG